MPKRVLEGGTQQDRAKIRRQLGTLRQLTVQPATRKRYDKAVDHFLGFLRREGIALPTNKMKLDPHGLAALAPSSLCNLLSDFLLRVEACPRIEGLERLDGRRARLPPTEVDRA